MKYKVTRRPGKPTEPRVTQLTLIAETEADRIRLGEFALKHNAIFLGPKPVTGNPK